MLKRESRVLDKGKVVLLEVMGDDKAIVDAARISYSTNKQKSISDDESLIRYLMRHRHTSVFEQVEFKFYLKMPIFVHNQFVRHRMASQNLLSGRYSEMPDEYYVPENNNVTFQNPNNKQGGTVESITPFNIKNPNDWWDCLTAEQVADIWDWSKTFSDEQTSIRTQYKKYIDSGMRKELARINLPLSQYTEMYWKIDLHNLFHFLSLRLDTHAQYEIQVYAEAIYDLIKPIVPLASKAFEDYRLNSISLSALDVEGLKKVILGEQVENTASTLFKNNREKSEFINKLSFLGLDGKENKKENS